MKKYLLISALVLLAFWGCEEQVDKLWDTSDDSGEATSDEVSPVAGDWYADSIKEYPGTDCAGDSSTDIIDIMSDDFIDSYNLWLQEDSTFGLYVDEVVNLEELCVAFTGIWDGVTGCYVEYYNITLSPVSMCSSLGYNEYDLDSGDCKQSTSLSGTWLTVTSDGDSTLTLNYDPFCRDSDGYTARDDNQDSCESNGNNWIPYKVDNLQYVLTDSMQLIINSIENDTCTVFYLYLDE